VRNAIGVHCVVGHETTGVLRFHGGETARGTRDTSRYCDPEVIHEKADTFVFHSTPPGIIDTANKR